MSTRVYVSIVLENAENKFLILKRDTTSRFAPGQWEFINGSIDEDETAEQTAVREVAEETGIKIAADDLIEWPVHELRDDDGRWVVIPYYVKAEDPAVILSPEHLEYRWIDKEELLRTPNVGEDFNKLLELLS